jgi:hypothetical protein
MTEHFLNAFGKLEPIIDIYESFNGWYWFITEYYKDDPDVAFGFVRGLEDEWGDIDLLEIREQMKRGRAWKVPKKNWFSISNVITKYKDKCRGDNGLVAFDEEFRQEVDSGHW